MKKRIAWAFVASAFVSAAPAAAPASQADAAALFAAGDRKADEGDYDGALDLWRQAYFAKIPEERDLPFRHPVPAEFMDRDALRKRMVEEIAKEYPKEKIEGDELTYRHLGMFGPAVDLEQTITDLLTEQIAGFYDPDTKKLYLIRETPKPDRKKGFLEKLFGSSDSFDPQEQKQVLAHEMCHALADQHFDLLSLSRSVADDDDESLAVTGVIEGEATVFMMADSLGRRFLRTSPGLLAGFMDLALAVLAPFAGGEKFGEAPLVLRESLMFPYVKGLRFCLTFTQNGHWDKVNRAFADPPASTEQLLHPEKYDPASRDEPVALSFEGDAPLPGNEWELAKENVLGEMAIEVLFRPTLSRARSAPAAAGWDGDRFRLYRRKGTKPAETLLVWASTWDEEKDAREFAEALGDQFAPKEAAGAPAVEGVPAAERLWARGDLLSGVWRQRRDVWFIDRVPRDRFAPLVTWSLKLHREPKKIVLNTFKPALPFPGE